MTPALFDAGAPATCPAPFNMAEYVLAAGEHTPDKIALAVLTLSGAERWSYAKLRQAVLSTATGLLEQSLAPGDRVLLRLGNSVDFPITYLAAIAAGLIPVPTSAQLTTPEVTKLAETVSPKLIVAEHGVTLPEGDAPTVFDVRELSKSDPAAFERGDPDRPAYIIFTSGTAGTPRAVTHAHRAIWARRMMWDGWYGLTQIDRVLHAGAFNWTYTLGTGLMDPWAIGATALIPGPGITPAQLPLLLKRHDATIFAAAPGVYRQMLRAPIAPMQKLRHGLSAGEKLPEVTRAAWGEATGTEIYEAYGMSECSTFISANPSAPAAPGSIGRPQQGRRIALLGDDTPVDIGAEGTISVHRDDQGLMLGFWSRSQNAPEPIETEWFRTGDTAVMAEDGTLTYMGRDDDMMNACGFRVSPIEVEQAMSLHPAVTDCAAVERQVKDDASVIALCYLADHDIETTELEAFASTRLARYKQPRIFVRLNALPRNANGKIQRRALRDR